MTEALYYAKGLHVFIARAAACFLRNGEDCATGAEARRIAEGAALTALDHRIKAEVLRGKADALSVGPEAA